MTHILIPIEDIEEQIKENKINLNKLNLFRGTSGWERLHAATEVLENILTYKQISLNEEDIEAKAKEVYPDQPALTYCINKQIGYKQALKDLTT